MDVSNVQSIPAALDDQFPVPGLPALSVEEDAPIDNQRLAGDGIGLAEHDGLGGDVPGAAGSLQDSPLARAFGDGRWQAERHPGVFDQARSDAVDGDLRGESDG